MNIADTVALLEERIGLDPESVGARHLASVIASRMRAGGVGDASAYADLARRDVEEFQQLVEEVTVTETCFFRDREPFRLLREEAGRITGRGGGSLRVLCAACATGEEAYSVSITCLEAGCLPGTYSVEGLDISRNALRFARAARYRSHSFRGHDSGYRDAYFDEDAGVYTPRACVLAPVRFREGNLVLPETLDGAGMYEAIFCRNLMIYLRQSVREDLLTRLDTHLAPGGVLFVGHAEMAGVHLPGYAPDPHPGAFAWRKGGGIARL